MEKVLRLLVLAVAIGVSLANPRFRRGATPMVDGPCTKVPTITLDDTVDLSGKWYVIDQFPTDPTYKCISLTNGKLDKGELDMTVVKVFASNGTALTCKGKISLDTAGLDSGSGKIILDEGAEKDLEYIFSVFANDGDYLGVHTCVTNGKQHYDRAETLSRTPEQNDDIEKKYEKILNDLPELKDLDMTDVSFDNCPKA